jgi:hypothetical protein
MANQAAVKLEPRPESQAEQLPEGDPGVDKSADFVKRSIILGGLGGVLPLIFNVHIDVPNLIGEFSSLEGGAFVQLSVGYVLRWVGLFTIGALVVYAQSEKHVLNRAKMIQIGAAAPAILTAWINGNSIPEPEGVELESAHSGLLHVMGSNTAYAEPSQQQTKVMEKQNPGGLQRVIQGLVGIKPKANNYFVIVGRFKTVEEAITRLDEAKKLGFAEAVVYEKYRNNEHYSVAVGSNLSLVEARRLKSQAVEAGLPDDSYIWELE